MGFKQKQVLQLNLRTKIILLSSLVAGMGMIIFLFFFGYFNAAIPQKASASTTETLSSGAFIINMGIVPQTIANGLLPYGLIYELTTTYNVPVKWIIEPTKAKDGTDFIHNGVTYKGGTFIIPAEYISTVVGNRIEYWRTQGVSGNYSVSSITVPVHAEITSFPKVMIDNLSGNDTIIKKYFSNAQIPAGAYECNTPSGLSSCHDIWINPHGDPTWATHNYLYNFVTAQKSFIWMQCHAVSMMEFCQNPVAPFQQLNYLSTTGLQCYQSAKCGTNPETHTKAFPGSMTYYYPEDPIMQFMGTMSSVSAGGSERWYSPLTSGGWRASTKKLVTTGTTLSPREGVLMVYGPAFGNPNNGLVMYTGGHDMNSGSTTDQVSAQRAFLNFLLVAGINKAPILTKTVSGNVNANSTDTFSVSVSGGSAPYSYSWTSSAGGTFSSPTASVTEFITGHTTIPLQAIITCVVTDACGRRNFFSQAITINASPLPISLISFTGKFEENGTISLQWKTASEFNNNYFTIARSLDGTNFKPWKNVPSRGNSSSLQTYNLVDNNPLPGINYYRLNQTDYDGKQVELSIIGVQNKVQDLTPSQVTAGPNPFQNRITVNFPTEYRGESKIRMWNVMGKMVYEKSIMLDGGNQQLLIESLDNLPKGTYLLRVFNGAIVSEGIKLIKN